MSQSRENELNKLQESIKKQLNRLYDNKVPKNIQNYQSFQQLNVLFNFYQQNQVFFENVINALNQQNAELKVREIELEDRVAELQGKLIDSLSKREPIQYFQISRKKNIQPKIIITEEQKIQVMRKIVQREQEINRMQANNHDLQVEVRKLNAEKSAIQEKVQVGKRQIDNLQEKEKSTQADIQKLKATINSLVKQNEDNKRQYEFKFHQEFEQTIKQMRDNQTNIRKGEKTNYEKQIKELQDSLKTIVNRVNDLLSISISTSGELSPQEQKSWIAQLEASAKRHLKEVNKYCSKKVRESTQQTLAVSDLAQLQKQKIAARRMYLMNSMLRDEK